jgi:hypothetical protein
VILSVHFDRTWHHGETPDEMSQLISQLLDNDDLAFSPLNHSPVGLDVWFCLSEQPHTDEKWATDNLLRVSVNRQTGYGALVWGVTKKSPRTGGIYEDAWISDNPQPLTFNPRLISDPGYPLFHDWSSAIPLASVRNALEEFCATGTGDRPECIQWVRGHFNGQRVDRDPIDDVVDNAEDSSPF